MFCRKIENLVEELFGTIYGLRASPPLFKHVWYMSFHELFRMYVRCFGVAGRIFNGYQLMGSPKSLISS